ncbi:MAG: cytochrome c biogenesis protein CcdA [Actinobacteria bacterium]|nr:cytochrome c biogenesis protein CcdA [Actinomycetota bacterium]
MSPVPGDPGWAEGISPGYAPGQPITKNKICGILPSLMVFATPLLFAFAAGMAATVNPCGFAMLPAYVSMFLGSDDGEESSVGLGTGLRVGASVTIGFFVLFSVVGLLVSAGLQSLVNYVPWVALVIGISLFVLGVSVLRGFKLSARMMNTKAGKGRSFRSMAGFGVAFGTASISCTLPIFLAVVGISTRSSSLLEGWAVFLAYAAGMGLVLTAIAVALATSRQVFVTRMRKILPHVERIGGWLLVTSGLFITYYWGVQLSFDLTSESALYKPIGFVTGISAWFTNGIANAPILWAGRLITVVLGIAAAEFARRRRRVPERSSS